MEDNRVSPEMEFAFNQLLSLARDTLSNARKAEGSGVAVLQTQKGEHHTILYADPNAQSQVLNLLRDREDTRIEYLLAMWDGDCLDLPSFSLRESLLALNAENANARLLLRGEDCLVVRTLISTMPKR